MLSGPLLAMWTYQTLLLPGSRMRGPGSPDRAGAAPLWRAARESKISPTFVLSFRSFGLTMTDSKIKTEVNARLKHLATKYVYNQ